MNPLSIKENGRPALSSKIKEDKGKKNHNQNRSKLKLPGKEKGKKSNTVLGNSRRQRKKNREGGKRKITKKMVRKDI